MMFPWIPSLCFLTVCSSLRIVDLTHEQNHATIYWPGNPSYNFTIIYRNSTNGGYWYESNSFATAEHGGTHVDSPAHFYQGGWRTQQIPMEKLVGKGVIINVKAKVSANYDYQVTVQDIMDWENSHGQIPDGAVVLMNSGWSDKYPDKNAVFSTTTPNDPNTFHFPGWHVDAVTWLTKNRKVHVIGVDTPSTDYGQSKTFPTHVVLGKNNIIGVENVGFLDRIPESGSTIFVAVVKLSDGSGGPARVFAMIDENQCTSGSDSHFRHVLSVILIMLIFGLFNL
ncbi:isatin hydrolase-like [Saccostrea echinata]|uniref:isatin hydrolase-like n=1 Tax=Saccostrea echinata TaxID=191078 RepID=UPI002A7FB654|nr:isatin hydrolase-like [Saccostrea echinata]